LAKALLWAAFNEQAREGIQLGNSIKDRFKLDHADIIGIEDTAFNPIEKVALHVMKGGEGELNILKMRLRVNNQQQHQGTTTTTTTTTDAATNNNNNQNMFVTPFIAEAGNNDVVMAPNVMMNQANVHTIMSMLHSMDQKIDGRFESVSAEVVANREYCQQMFTTVNNNIRRYGGTIQSAFANQQRQQQERPEQQEPIHLFGLYGNKDPRARLINRPRDLYVLWREWIEGVNGNKPAKDFTTAERNNSRDGMKQKFYRRLHVWKIQCRLIDGGMSIIAANNRICSITGERSVTKIIDKLISFRNVYKEHGGIHPQLMNGM
jgi:hypothetical protein